MSFVAETSTLVAYVQVILINVVLSGDNVVVVGMAAAGLAPNLRSRAIAIGIIIATVVRLVFALVATQLLAVPGLLLGGGLLLLWVCWKMWEELRHQQQDEDTGAPGTSGASHKTLRQAVVQIAVADVSMSLDNVLAVAGASKHDLAALSFGLILSVVLMAVAASQLAKLLTRYEWIAWLGLAIILYVAAGMIYQGTNELVGGVLPALPIFG